MIRINLLPHREEKRKERKRQFWVLAGLMLVFGAVIGLLGHMVIGSYIDSQEHRNQIFKTEISKLDKQIAEIQRLHGQINALLDRKQIIESLQSHRAETVHLFNELVRQVPEGIDLTSVKQSGPKITLSGYAQSNARVSTLMRNLEGSAYLEKPELVEIKAATFNDRRVGQFSLDVSLKRPKTDDGKPGSEK